MTPYVRPIVVSLLCGLAILGHAPAWWHISGCEHTGQHHASAPDTTGECHHAECHHHNRGDAFPGDASSGDAANDWDPHDSDHCAICQSLAVPSGVSWKLDLPLAEQACVSTSTPADSHAPESTYLSIPQPRGPPAFSA